VLKKTAGIVERKAISAVLQIEETQGHAGLGAQLIITPRALKRKKPAVEQVLVGSFSVARVGFEPTTKGL
jgi:hypothetical protein